MSGNFEGGIEDRGGRRRGYSGIRRRTGLEELRMTREIEKRFFSQEKVFGIFAGIFFFFWVQSFFCLITA